MIERIFDTKKAIPRKNASNNAYNNAPLNNATRKPIAPLIKVENLVKRYDELAGSVTALKGVDLKVYPGEFLVVTGRSGAGKTTLVNMLAGLDRSTSGEIWVDDTPIHTLGPEQVAAWRGQTVGVVFQSFELLPNLSVLQNVTLPMDFANRFSIRQRRQRGMKLLEQMGIAEHAHKPPTDVSGGQQQRIAIARALANDPPIIIADEPTGSLDSVTADAVLQVLEGLVEEGKTLVLVTHDRDIVQRASRAITLADGEIVELLTNPVAEHPTTTAGHRQPNTDDRLPAIGHRQPITDDPQPTTDPHPREAVYA